MAEERTLRDGTAVTVRAMTGDDLDRSFTFFQELPPEDRAYLRRDVTQRDVVEDRIRAMDSGRIKRLIALADDRIVADATLELTRGWEEHVGELRLIVARDFQRRGLGLLMARELYSAAVEAQLEQLVVKMARPQMAARSIFRKLGFKEEGVFPSYVKDVHGQKHDLVMMRCDLEALWRELEDFVAARDWQRMR